MWLAVLHVNFEDFRSIWMPLVLWPVKNVFRVGFLTPQLTGNFIFLGRPVTLSVCKTYDPSLPAIVEIFNCFTMTLSVLPSGNRLGRALFEGFYGLAGKDLVRARGVSLVICDSNQSLAVEV